MQSIILAFILFSTMILLVYFISISILPIPFFLFFLFFLFYSLLHLDLLHVLVLVLVPVQDCILVALPTIPTSTLFGKKVYRLQEDLQEVKPVTFIKILKLCCESKTVASSHDRCGFHE